MLSVPKLGFSLSIAALSIRLATGRPDLLCGGDKPLSFCCAQVTPAASFAQHPGELFGYKPSAPNELIGARCFDGRNKPEGCPANTIATCCAGKWPTKDDQFTLGTNCGTSSSAFPPVNPPPIPAGWKVDYPCSSDTHDRVLLNDIVAKLPTNTPANCINFCTSQTYTYAGVEYGDECHCGTGYKPSFRGPLSIPPNKCDVRCAGDDRYTCGGALAIQLFHGPTPKEVFPSGWNEARACAVDTPARVLTEIKTFNYDDNTPARCVARCLEKGFAYAGVEFGKECHCGTGIKPGTEDAPVGECSSLCTGNFGLTCGGSGRIQIFSSAEKCDN